MTGCHDFTCGQVRAGEPYQEGRDCRKCWAAVHHPDVARSLGREPVPVRRTPVRLPCLHEEPGVILSRCPHGDEGRHVRRCRLHGSCTRERAGAQARVCANCDDHAAPTVAPITRRHLAYFVCPVSGNGVWQRGVDQLRLRWGLFNGRKVFAVATGGPVRLQHGGRTAPLDSPAAVRAYLPPGAEVIEVPQDPARWELAGWGPLWESVLGGADDADAVLYAHAKGVTRPATITTGFGATTQSWAALLYTLSLDYWPLVDEQLRRLPIAGAFRRVGHFYRAGDPTRHPDMTRSGWQYSGNFWWARAGEVRVRLRQTPVPEDPWGTEAWPGIAFSGDEAGMIGPPQLSSIDPYNLDQWNQVVGPAYATWLLQNRPADGPPTGPPQAPAGRCRLSVIVATRGRDTLARTIASVTPQMAHGDELIVERDESGGWGAPARARAIRQAGGDYLAFLDDDDTSTPTALAAIRAALAEAPGRPHLFRMRYADGHTLWADREVRFGNVGTPMFVAPNDRFRLGAWGTEYDGDYRFITSTVAAYPPGSLVWRDEVVCLVRPD